MQDLLLLTGSPWDSPTSLLRSPVAWVRAIFVEASTRPSSAHILQVQWFGEVEGVCSWQNICTYDGLFHTFTYGLTNCRHHMAMLYQPSVFQIALVCHSDWDVLHSSERAFECGKMHHSTTPEKTPSVDPPVFFLLTLAPANVGHIQGKLSDAPAKNQM